MSEIGTKILVGVILLLGGTSPALAAEPEATLSLGLSKIFTFFFLTLGPKAVIAPFARSTAALQPEARRKVAFATTAISLVSIGVAATIGVRVLTNWGVSHGALLIAAGIILFLIALESIRHLYQPDDHSAADTQSADSDVSVRLLAYRLAFPYVVSPYGVAVVILVLSTRPDFVSLTPILAMLGGIMLLNLLAMLGARRIASSPYIAPAFAVVGAVLGVLQAALGVQAILVGLRLAGVVGGT